MFYTKHFYFDSNAGNAMWNVKIKVSWTRITQYKKRFHVWWLVSLQNEAKSTTSLNNRNDVHQILLFGLLRHRHERHGTIIEAHNQKPNDISPTWGRDVFRWSHERLSVSLSVFMRRIFVHTYHFDASVNKNCFRLAKPRNCFFFLFIYIFAKYFRVRLIK